MKNLKEFELEYIEDSPMVQRYKATMRKLKEHVADTITLFSDIQSKNNELMNINGTVEIF